MDTLQSIEAVGATVDEAIARGLDALNVTRADVVIAVIDEGNRGSGGGRQREARVRLTIQARPAAAAPHSQSPIADNAVQTLQELLDKMRVKAQVTARWDTIETRHEKSLPRLVLDVRGADLAVLIGRRSETIEALQYITRLIVLREAHESEQKFDIVVDVEGYKTRRENQLRQLAQRMAERVESTRKAVALEPMPAQERRIIHIALRNHPTVTTESVGRGDNRKVTIIPKRK